MSLQDLPTYPPIGSLSTDDLIPVIDNSDRRSPKKATVAQIVNIAAGADVSAFDDRITDLEDVAQDELADVESNADKLASNPFFGELYRITDEANRIERFVGGATNGFSITNVGSAEPLSVTGYGPTGKPGFEQAALQYWYANWDSGSPDEWAIANGDDGNIWTSDEDVASPLDVVGWTKVFEEPDEENPLYPATPTLVAAPAANDEAWLVEKNTVALTVDNAQGVDLTINGVFCENTTLTFVGWAVPTSVDSDGDVVYATGTVVNGTEVISTPFYTDGSPINIPISLADRASVTIYLFD